MASSVVPRRDVPMAAARARQRGNVHAELDRIVADAGSLVEHRVLCEIETAGQRFPVHAISLGNRDPAVPAIGFFGGVHGLERVGSEVVLAYLQGLVAQLRWDRLLQRQLEMLRWIFVPIVNPGGMWHGTRANAAGVDLMRNAPVDAGEAALAFVGGQRISAKLPWYRGPAGAPMQPEARALCRVVREELLARPFSIAIDCHSGFGLQDRIWFPYAFTSAPFPHLAEMHALKSLFEATHANHRYVFEPQSRQYLAHGDLWDYLHLEATREGGRTFMPLTLEMGSWMWVKKNPRQLLSRHGLFNPLIEHRLQRVLRRHYAWLDFVARAACSHETWVPTGDARAVHREAATRAWYSRG